MCQHPRAGGGKACFCTAHSAAGWWPKGLGTRPPQAQTQEACQGGKGLVSGRENDGAAFLQRDQLWARQPGEAHQGLKEQKSASVYLVLHLLLGGVGVMAFRPPHLARLDA